MAKGTTNEVSYNNLILNFDRVGQISKSAYFLVIQHLLRFTDILIYYTFFRLRQIQLAVDYILLLIHFTLYMFVKQTTVVKCLYTYLY